MAGNRDFLVGDALLERCGVTRLPDPTAARRLRPARCCSRTATRCAWPTSPTSAFGRPVRSPAWQRALLALPLAGAQRDRARRCATRARPAQRRPARPLGRRRRRRRRGWLREPGAGAGPRPHPPPGEPRRSAPGYVRHVLSDWDLDGTAARAPRCCAGRADGFARIAPDAAAIGRRALSGWLRAGATSAPSSAAPIPDALWQLTLARYPFLAARSDAGPAGAAPPATPVPRRTRSSPAPAASR